jgi:hypothetical protein
MSRGPGRWQRAILAALEQHGAVWMRDLLPPEASCEYQWEQLAAQRACRAQYSALHRAACRLCDAGRIEMAFCHSYEVLGHYSGGCTVLVSPGKTAPEAKDIPRLSVDKVPDENLVNT